MPIGYQRSAKKALTDSSARGDDQAYGAAMRRILDAVKIMHERGVLLMVTEVYPYFGVAPFVAAPALLQNAGATVTGSEDVRIQSPNGKGQRGSVSGPSQIGVQQDRCEQVAALKANDRGHDEAPQNQHLGEREVSSMESEK
jgi:hypothetical protein